MRFYKDFIIYKRYIYIPGQSNVFNGSVSRITSYTPPTYPYGSERYTFLTGAYGGWVTTEIEVNQLF